MTPSTPATNLNALTLDEMWDEWVWLQNQDQTAIILNAIRKCEAAILNRQAQVDAANAVLEG